MPDSSNSWYTPSVGLFLTRNAGTTSCNPRPANLTASVSTGSSAPPYDSAMTIFCFLLHDPRIAASASCAGPVFVWANSVSLESCVGRFSYSEQAVLNSGVHLSWW